MEIIIENLLIETATAVSNDAISLISLAKNKENGRAAKQILKTIQDNITIAKKEKRPVCQSPGYGTIYIKFGDSSQLSNIEESVKNSFTKLTSKGYFRPSIVDPLTRKNNGDNSGYRAPNIEYIFEKDLEYVEIVPSSKGCGTEVFNKMKVFTYEEIGQNYSGIKKFILEAVSDAGGKVCLPGAIGIGIGGQIDVAAKLSREAVSLRSWKDKNEEGYIANLEQEILEEINKLNIGCGGMGGDNHSISCKD